MTHLSRAHDRFETQWERVSASKNLRLVWDHSVGSTNPTLGNLPSLLFTSFFGSKFDNKKSQELTWRRRRRWTTPKVSSGALDLCFHLPAHHMSGSSARHTSCFSFPFPWVLTAAAAYGRYPQAPPTPLPRVAFTLTSWATTVMDRHLEPSNIRAGRDLRTHPILCLPELFHGTLQMDFLKGKEGSEAKLVKQFPWCRTSQCL